MERRAGEEAPPRLPVVVTVFNQKGGIGKTTTSVNLAACLAAGGWRVALIDVDSQSNATTSLGIIATPAPGAYHLLKGSVPVAETLQPTRFPGLSVCRAEDELAGIGIELALEPHPHAMLRQSLAAGGMDVDVVIIDCPPALGPLPVNALAASQLVVVPVTPEPMARDGLHRAWRHIQRIRSKLNPRLEFAGIVLTMAREDAVHTALSSTLRAEMGNALLTVEIPFDPQVPAASRHDLPVCVYDPHCPASRAYLVMAEGLARNVRRLAGSEGQEGGFDGARARMALQEWNLTTLGPLPAPGDVPAPNTGWVTVDPETEARTGPELPSALPEGRHLTERFAATAGFAVGTGLGIGLAFLGRNLGWLP